MYRGMKIEKKKNTAKVALYIFRIRCICNVHRRRSCRELTMVRSTDRPSKGSSTASMSSRMALSSVLRFIRLGKKTGARSRKTKTKTNKSRH